MTKKPEIGMTVYLRPTIYNKDKEVYEGTLTKIGRKYYTVSALHQEFKFNLDDLTLISDYSQTYSLYFSKSHLEQEVEREELILKLSRFFQYASCANCRLTVERLREIARLSGVIP